MYQAYWRLAAKPFETAADPRFYYPAEAHQAALLKLRYTVENRRGAALLSGIPGGGKTLLVCLLRQMLGEEYAPIVHLGFPQMAPAELVAYLAEGLLGDDAGGGVHQSVRRIERFLTENARRGRHAVAVLDEAHLLADPETLETVRLLTNFECDGRPAWTVLLVGQTPILPLLDRMPQLDERLAVKCLLRPFSADETAAYASHRLRAAGAAEAIFDDEALATLFPLTQGIPRRINRLCDLALLLAFAEGRGQVAASDLEELSGELAAAAVK